MAFTGVSIVEQVFQELRPTHSADELTGVMPYYSFATSLGTRESPTKKVVSSRFG